jgi:hypothetical protein
VQVTDDSTGVALSRALPRGTVLAKLADARWRKELFLVATVVRGARLRFPLHAAA